jgi:trimeric autotransporter adhesin
MTVAAGRWAVLVLALSLGFAPRVRAAEPDRAEHPATGTLPAEREDRAEPEEESSFQSDFFRRLAGGEMDAQRTAAMWRDMLASPTEAQATAAVNSWQLVGPIYSTNTGGGRMTGRVRDIDARHQRVLAASGGLWRFNFGAIPMSDGVPATWFGSFATHPLDANTILLGTGEYGKGNGMGLFKTIDGGATWTFKSMFPQPSQYTRIRYSPDGSVVHAASEIGYYRSIDNGETWTRTLSGTVTDLTMTWGDPNRLFATVANLGLWRSLDAGMTWSQISGGGIPTSGTGNGAVAATHLYPSDVVWIYVAFDAALYRSQDGGGTWTNITPSYTVGNSGYGPAISVCPDDGNTVLYGNVPYNRSIDGGAHWTKISPAHLHADYHVFDWDADGFGVWAGHDGGWSHSTDRGLTWDSSSNVMPISQFYSIDCEKNVVGYMVGGTQDNNILYTPNQALFWTDPAVGSTEGDATGACINGYDPTQMWSVTGVVSGPITYPRYRTINGGTTWGQVVSGIAANSYNGGVIRNDNTFPIKLVTSVGPYVYESADGISWALSNPGGFPANIQNLTSTVRVSPSAVLYATLTGSTSGQRLYVRDGGTWYERSGNLPAGTVTKVVPHPWFAYADEAWAIVVGSGQRISHTADRGVTWTNVTGDLPAGIVVTDVVPNPRRSNELYAGTLNGLYRTKNSGVNWERWNNGMPPVMITEMATIDLTTTTGQVFVVAATYGRSVWKRDVSGDDPLPTVTVSNPMVDETDNATTAWFVATLSAPSTTAVTVDFTTQDSTATAADNDYQPASGPIYFAPGQTTQYVTVQVNGDTRYEPDETFKLVLSNPVRTLVGANPVATIQDDDAWRFVRPDLYVTDGTVSAIATSGNTVYVGGSFQHVGAPTGGAVPIDAGSAQPIWLPKVAGQVYAVAPDGSGGWYIGGSFTHVAGHPRINLAHFLPDHSLDYWNPGANDIVQSLAVSNNIIYVAGRFTTIAGVPRNCLAAIDAAGLATDWNPNPNNTVIAVLVSGNTIYAAGDFTTLGGQSRNRIAALSATSGLATGWNPNANGSVGAMALSGSTLYVGGSFTSIGGQPRRYAAALDVANNSATGWDPNANDIVFGLAVDATRAYLGGVFDSLGGQPRSNLAAVDRLGGAVIPWTPNPDGPVIGLALSGSTVYVGGAFGGIGGQYRNNLAALDAASGLASAWNPDPAGSVVAIAVNGSTVMLGGVFTSLAPQVRNNIAALDATTGMVTWWNPNANGSVLTLALNNGLVYAGGSFTTIGGQTRNRIAALDSLNGQATGWDPNADGTVRTIALAGRFYVGGSFTTIGGQARNRVAQLSLSTGLATTWNPNASGTVRSLVTDGTAVYAGGLFASIGGQARNNLAALSTSSGAASTTFAPNPDGQINALMVDGTALYVGGAFQNIGTTHLNRLALINLSTSAVATWNPAPNDDVNTLLRSSSVDIFVGGAFTVIGGQPRNRLALIRTVNAQASTWAPNASGPVEALAVSGAVIYAGGSFASMGGMPEAHIAAMLPTALVDVPEAPTPAPGLSLRLGPNPSHGRVRIEYTLPEAGRVRIAIYDVQGRRVASVVDEAQAAGEHDVPWEGETAGARVVAPGLYFVRLLAGRSMAVGRILIFD